MRKALTIALFFMSMFALLAGAASANGLTVTTDHGTTDLVDSTNTPTGNTATSTQGTNVSFTNNTGVSVTIDIKLNGEVITSFGLLNGHATTPSPNSLATGSYDICARVAGQPPSANIEIGHLTTV